MRAEDAPSPSSVQPPSFPKHQPKENKELAPWTPLKESTGELLLISYFRGEISRRGSALRTIFPSL